MVFAFILCPVLNKKNKEQAYELLNLDFLYSAVCGLVFTPEDFIHLWVYQGNYRYHISNTLQFEEKSENESLSYVYMACWIEETV